MAIKPILFNDEMVRAILSRRKTQTRRPLRPIWHQHFARVLCGDDIREFSHLDESQQYWGGCTKRDGSDCCSAKAAFASGDVLWVRECWTPDHSAFYPNFPITYRADFGPEYERNEHGEVYSPEEKAWFPFRWRPSIHMPLSVARLFLRVTEVRCQRLLDITDADAECDLRRIEARRLGVGVCLHI
jgi:hypothetical protein